MKEMFWRNGFDSGRYVFPYICDNDIVELFKRFEKEGVELVAIEVDGYSLQFLVKETKPKSD